MGGGIAMFTGIRNRVPATGLNPAFLSKYHNRFFPKGWEQWTPENISVFSASNYILSQQLDNPANGGILPTELPRAISVYLTQAPNSADMDGGLNSIFHSIRGHYLTSLLFSLFHNVYSLKYDGDLDLVYQTFDQLPQHIRDAYYATYPDDHHEEFPKSYCSVA